MKKLVTLMVSIAMMFGMLCTAVPAAAAESVSVPTPFIDQDAEGIDGNLRKVDSDSYYSFTNVIAGGSNAVEYSQYAQREFNFTATQYKQGDKENWLHGGSFKASATSNDVTISTWINISNFIIINNDPRGTRIFSLDNVSNTNARYSDLWLEVRKDGTLWLGAYTYDENGTNIGGVEKSDGKYRWPMTWSEEYKYKFASENPTGTLLNKDGIDKCISAVPGEENSRWMFASATMKYDEENHKMIYNVYINGEHVFKDVEVALTGTAAPRKITAVKLNTWGGISPELKKYARLKMYNDDLTGEQIRSIYNSEKEYFVSNDAPAFSLGFNGSNGIINDTTMQPMNIYEYKYGNDIGKVAKATGTNKYTGESFDYVDIESYSHFYTDSDFISDTDTTLEFWWHVPATAAGNNAMATISRGAGKQPIMSLRFGPDGNIVVTSAQTAEDLTSGTQIFSKGGLIVNPTPRELANDTTLERPWHHIALTRSWNESSRMFRYTLYFNGKQVASGAETLPEGKEPLSNEGYLFGLNMLRGTDVPHTKNDGMNDMVWSQAAGFMDAKVYNKVLTADEISKEYSSKTAILADKAEFTISDKMITTKGSNIPVEDLSEAYLEDGDGKVYGKANYVNYTGKSYNVVPVLAAYDANGRLQNAVACDIIEISSAYGGGKIETSKGIDVLGDTEKVTMFMFDGVKTIAPQTGAVSAYRATAPLNNVMAKLTSDTDKAKVLFIGGSITAGNGATNATGGYAKLTGEWLKNTYGATYNISALGGTGSDLANARIGYLMDTYTPDLVFVEYAVNDSCNAVNDDSYKYYQKNTEGIVRKILEKNPSADIVLVNTMHKYMYTGYYDSGKLHPTIIAKDEIARAFDLGLVNVGKQAAINVLSESAAWSDYFGTDNCHPNDAGATQYAKTLEEYITKAVANYNENLSRSAAPTSAVNADGYYFNGSFAPIANATGIDNWTKGTNSTDGSYLYTTTGDKHITYTFSGNGIGIFNAQRLNGTLKCKIDGGDEITVTGNNSFYQYIKKDLTDGSHTIEIWNAGTTEEGFNSFLILNKQ